MSPTLRATTWPAALAAARDGDLSLAFRARDTDAQGAQADYLYGRCLAEAGVALDEAIGLLRTSLTVDPGNPLAPHALALALARRAGPGDHSLAALLWRDHHLPHDLELLGQTALTFEAQLQPIPRPDQVAELPWPEELPRLAPIEREEFPEPSLTELDKSFDLHEVPAVEALPEVHTERDKLTLPAASKAAPRPGWFARREQGRLLVQLEEDINQRNPWRALQRAEAELKAGRSSAELHLVAGVACEDAGLYERGRAHLSRALELEPALLHARVMLGRAYWRLNWLDLAMGVWRSLPVEGPYDYYRHYHLALGHAARLDRPAANLAMRVALSEFFFDTRHAFIQRAWERWKHAITRLPDPSAFPPAAVN